MGLRNGGEKFGIELNSNVGVEFMNEQLKVLKQISEWIAKKTAPTAKRKYSRCSICKETWCDKPDHALTCWVPRLHRTIAAPTESEPQR